MFTKQQMQQERSFTEAIRQRINKLRDIEEIFDNVDAFIFVKDDKNRIVYANKFACDIMKVKCADIAYKDLSELTDDEDLIQKYGRNDLDVLQGKPKLNIKEPLFTDPQRWFITHKLPIMLNDKVWGVLGFSVELDGRQDN